jgi:tetratricopeptide (TPR) repeat protein
MADLKEETTVNTPENRVEGTTAKKRSADPGLDGIQNFYEKNKSAVNYVAIALAVAVAGFIYFKAYYLPEQETEAANEMFWAQSYFEKDSFNIALRGGKMVMSPDGQKQMKGFEQVADEYSLTKSGNLANYYTGVCYLRTAQFEQAIEFLKKYDGDDKVVSSVAIGAIGDCHMELNQVDEAIKYYTKAADNSENNFTTPYFLKKAAFAQETKGDFAAALNSLERIQKEFNSTAEGREVQRDIARVKTRGNL